MSRNHSDSRVKAFGRLGSLLVLTFAAVASQAQTYTVLADIGASGPLIQGSNGKMYAAGNALGVSGPYGHGGSIFNITSTGTVTTVYPFCSLANCADGAEPLGVTLGTDGNYYGVTRGGGANSSIDCSGETAQPCGTVFKLTPSGELTTLHSFCSQANCTDGSLPNGVLVQGLNGNFYGTTSYGGTGTCPNYDGFQPVGCGTIFEVTTAGVLTTLYNFCAEGCVNGWAMLGSLTLDPNGKFYGTTDYGGTGGGGTQCGQGCGTLFTFTPPAGFDSVYSFCIPTGCPDGALPQSSLVLATGGTFYGTTTEGGTANDGTFFSYGASGGVSSLYSFCIESGCPDGQYPQGIIQGSDGNFYGITPSGGANQGGTLFKITAAGSLTTLYSFCEQTNCYDGIAPNVTPVEATDGTLYGAAAGGNPGNGVIYRYAAGLRRFVKTVPVAGRAGTEVIILGNGLTGASAVTFGGIAAKFVPLEASEIKAVVPKGAASGYVKVTTSTGAILSTLVPFYVP